MAGFEYAIAGLKSGQKVARAKWKNVRFIFLCEGGMPVQQVVNSKYETKSDYESHAELNVLRGRIGNFIAAVTGSGCIYPWVPSQEDMISEDWFEVNIGEF